MPKPFRKSKLNSSLGNLSLLLLIPSIFLNLIFYSKLQKSEEGIPILGVLDGDTITLEGKTRLRLRNIDAPELNFCGGVEAKKELEKLVTGKKVVVKEETIDTWSRPMALIYIGSKLINEEMLKTGWVRFHSDSTSERDVLKKAYDDARAKKIGVYSQKCTQKINLVNPKCNIKGNFDKNSDKKNYYF